MTHWKTTLLLLLTAIGAGSYVALYEIKQPTPEERQELAKRVARFAPDDVTSLLVELPSLNVTLERKQGAWRLVSPLSARAEDSLVQRVLDELDPLDAERMLESSKDKPLALSTYGLDPPRGALTIIAGTRATQLLFGEKTAVGENRYAKVVTSPKVAIIRGGFFDTVNQPLEAYRSHDLLAFDTWRTRQLDITTQTVSYTLVKHGERWQLTRPLTDDADSGAAPTTLSTLRNLRIERFLTDSPQVEQLATWGFDAPYAHVTVMLENTSKPLELFIGKPTPDNADQLYAKRVDEPTLYAVAKSRVDELLQDPQSLRSEMVLDVVASQVSKVQLTWQGQTWTLEKANEQWTLTEGRLPLETSKVEDFLGKLRDVKLTRFVEDQPSELARYGLAPPKGIIEVWEAAQQGSKQLLIGDPINQGAAPARPSDEGAGGRYGRVTGRASIVELPSSLNEILATTPDSFQTQSKNNATSNR